MVILLLVGIFEYTKELSYSKTERVPWIDDIEHLDICNVMKIN